MTDTIPVAKLILQCFFQAVSGKTDQQIDVGLILEKIKFSPERTQAGLKYLSNRGLIDMFGPSIAFLTPAGLLAMDQNLMFLPVNTASQAALTIRKPTVRSAQITYTDQEGAHHLVKIDEVCSIGRSATCTIQLSDVRVSKQHAEIRLNYERYILRDLGTSNGTLVNGGHIDTHLLRHGDEIVIGRTELTFECVARPSVSATVVPAAPLPSVDDLYLQPPAALPLLLSEKIEPNFFRTLERLRHQVRRAQLHATDRQALLDALRLLAEHPYLRMILDNPPLNLEKTAGDP